MRAYPQATLYPQAILYPLAEYLELSSAFEDYGREQNPFGWKSNGPVTLAVANATRQMPEERDVAMKPSETTTVSSPNNPLFGADLRTQQKIEQATPAETATPAEPSFLPVEDEPHPRNFEELREALHSRRELEPHDQLLWDRYTHVRTDEARLWHCPTHLFQNKDCHPSYP